MAKSLERSPEIRGKDILHLKLTENWLDFVGSQRKDADWGVFAVITKTSFLLDY
jgi:hypothetical protein